MMYIRYEDIYRRDRGTPWKIDRRDVLPDWTETRPLAQAGEAR